MGDIGACLWAINERLGAEHRAEADLFAAVRSMLTAEIGENQAHDDGFPVKPQRILHDLRAEMGDEDIVISDVGAHKMWAARQYPAFAPNTCIISNGFCSMAMSLPGSIAAKLTHPDRRVVALQGDGGFLMNVQELATAVQYGVAAVQLVWEDSAYGLIEWKQMAGYGRTSHTSFVNPDLVALGRAFGAHARRVGSAAELRPALAEAFAAEDLPSVIVVPVDYSENMLLTRRLGEMLAR
ncbi:MAG: thiamine pyrophosphate-dependent enzyme [Acidimicrobiales bacterium]